MKVKMCGDEQWKKAAMMDDTVVAELLLQLNAPPSPPPPKPPLAVEWKVRQRRSKTLTGKSPLPRASPTTPLSWSGGTSVSGGAVDGGSEGSSQPQPPPKKPQSSRSKVTATGKRPRKKKVILDSSNTNNFKRTLVELKAAELALEEERKQLIEEVKRVRENLDRERSSNEKLKRLKIELESQTVNSVDGPCSSNQVAPSSQIEKLASSDLHAATTFSSKKCSSFAIPDLNLPLEDDFQHRGSM